jgi:4'-phosphopantetheinyl transferase
VLAKYLAMAPEEITFCYSEKGKPALAKPAHEDNNFQFNVSHSGAAALFGFTRRSQIGVDIEHIRHDVEIHTIARRFFSTREQSELATFPEALQLQLFFRIWTLKESFIKALGEGLSLPLDQFDVSVDPNSPPSLTTRPDAMDTQRWHLQVLDAGANYAAAFAVSQH